MRYAIFSTFNKQDYVFDKFSGCAVSERFENREIAQDICNEMNKLNLKLHKKYPDFVEIFDWEE